MNENVLISDLKYGTMICCCGIFVLYARQHNNKLSLSKYASIFRITVSIG